MRVKRVVGLAVLAIVVFVVSVVALSVALVVVAGTAFSEDCAQGENCYTDVYVGPGVLVLTVAVSVALTTPAVRFAARRTRRS